LKKLTESFDNWGRPISEQVGVRVTRDAFTYVEPSQKTNCAGCKFFIEGESLCSVFTELNQSNPDMFDLEEKVSPEGGCKAFLPKEGE